MSLTKERGAGKRARTFQNGSDCCIDVGHSYSTNRTGDRKVLVLSPLRLDHCESHLKRVRRLNVPIVVTSTVVIPMFMEFPPYQIFHFSAEQVYENYSALILQIKPKKHLG